MTAKHRVKEPPTVSGLARLKKALLPVLIILVGLGVMLYPVVASQWNNFVQRDIANRYDAVIAQQQRDEPEKLNQAVEGAREYNAAHTDGPILDPWLARVSKDNQEYQDYLAQLSGQSAMSQVTIPAIDSKLPVYHGTEPDTLQKGLGHLYGSALPVGGEGSNAVFTGHTGITNATLWDNLIEVKKGDEIFINTFGEKMKYVVYDIEVVLPHETDSLAAQPGRDTITLITCTPYGVNSHRLLVHAERAPMTEEDHQTLEETSGFTMQWWMWAVIAAAVLVLALMAWWVYRQLSRSRKDGNYDD